MPVRINGATSGYVELAAPAVAGSVVMTLPATTGTLAVQGEAYGRSATATVATNETTSSSTYVDLATAGPAVTVTTGTKALVIVWAWMYGRVSTATPHMGFAVSGSTTVAAADAFSASIVATGVDTPAGTQTGTFLVTGLTAGSNTFTAKYRTEITNSSGYKSRYITVIDMGS